MGKWWISGICSQPGTERAMGAGEMPTHWAALSLPALGAAVPPSWAERALYLDGGSAAQAESVLSSTIPLVFTLNLAETFIRCIQS